MKLNHVNLSVTNVAEAAAFLEKYFGMKNQFAEHDDKFTVLFDDDGLVLTLMKARNVSYPRTFHIGFMQASEEHVNELNRRLREDGFDVPPPQQSHAWTFYVNAPGGFQVEVMS